MHWNTWFQEISFHKRILQVKTRQRHFVNFNFHTSVTFYSGHPAAAASEPSVSLSANLFGRATVPVSAILVPSHTQFLLPVRLASHQLESQWLCCDFFCKLRVSSLQAAHHQFKFSPVISVQVHIRVGALPIVLSESRYITWVQHSESVVFRLRDSDQFPTWSR